MKRETVAALRRRVLAMLTAAGTLWTVAVTADSDTLLSAAAAVRTALPMAALRWELGDFWTEDTLSPAAVLTIGESPLLLSAREDVAKLWSASSGEEPAQEDLSPVPTPVTETPLKADTEQLDDVDNGVPARTLVPTDATGYTVVGSAYISNSTDYSLSIPSLTGEFDAELGEGSPQILILHTHGSECYTPPEGTDIVYSGDHRSTDTRYGVVRVGDVIAQVFADAGISVLHDRTLYDYPSYSEAYDRALSAIQSNLAQYPSIRFVLDIHRDAIEDSDGNQYKVVSCIDGVGTAAQVTLVVGSDGSGLSHPNWMENLQLAVALQQTALNAYPTLMRPILLRNSRYNQHATTGSLLLEVGAAGNSPDEAALAGRLFAQKMVETLEARSK